jgi:hypothetical protein
MSRLSINTNTLTFDEEECIFQNHYHWACENRDGGVENKIEIEIISDSRCPICYEGQDPENVYMLSCECPYTYHEECAINSIESDLTHQRRCPLCREVGVQLFLIYKNNMKKVFTLQKEII